MNCDGNRGFGAIKGVGGVQRVRGCRRRRHDHGRTADGSRTWRNYDVTSAGDLPGESDLSTRGY